jgi:hypothetical protein
MFGMEVSVMTVNVEKLLAAGLALDQLFQHPAMLQLPMTKKLSINDHK